MRKSSLTLPAVALAFVMACGAASATTIDAFIDIVPSFTPTSGPLGTTFTFTGVVSIDINVSPTPLPAALPLFGALGLFGWRTKRKKAAAITA